MGSEGLVVAKDLFKTKPKVTEEAEDDIPAQDEEEKDVKTEPKDEGIFKKTRIICSLLVPCTVYE